VSIIAFIGLGHMGSPMVQNLIKHGHQLYVYDLDNHAMQHLTKHGAIAAKSPADAATHADVLYTMLQTDEQVKAVCLGANGMFQHAKANALYIDSSSIDIDASREMHRQALSAHIRMVDAPVSGGVAGAQAASLTVMVGGNQENFDAAKPFLECVGKKVIHAGAAACGQAAKICNNMILGISMIAVAEGFALAKKLELDPQKFFEISSQASGQCWSMTHYCPEPNLVANVPSDNDYQPGFTAEMMLKDLRLSQEAARNAHAATPLGAAATNLYALFANLGHGQLDFSGIIKMIKGIEI